jgi:hypothetical protein
MKEVKDAKEVETQPPCAIGQLGSPHSVTTTATMTEL